MAAKDEEIDNWRNGWKQLEEEITCAICTEIFKEPKTLPCLHTFCKQCIQLNIDKKKDTCPLCRSRLPKDGIASITTNFNVIRLIEIYSNRSKGGQVGNSCDECDREASTAACRWCIDCQKVLCVECYKPHNVWKSLKHHKSLTMDEFAKSPKALLTANPKPQYCSEHEGQLLELYCNTCARVICRDCTYVDHPRGEHQFEFLKKVMNSKQAKIKELAVPIQSLLVRVQTAIKNVELSKQGVDRRCSTNAKEVGAFFKDLHKVLHAQEAKLLRDVDVIKSTSHKLLDSQKVNLLSVEKQLSSCNSSVSVMIQSTNIDELSTYMTWVDGRVVDLTSLIERADLDPVCNADSTVWCSDPSVFTTYCQSLCNVAGPPHIPNCSTKVPACIPRCHHPVVITVTLNDAYGFPVTNQSKHLMIQSEEIRINSSEVKECVHGVYDISYYPKDRKNHSIKVSWNNSVLREVDVSMVIRDYANIHEEVLIIDKYGPTNKKFTSPWHVANGPNNELIACDAAGVVVFNEQLQYSHVIGAEGDGKLTLASGVAVDREGLVYVTDCRAHSVKKFNMDGSFVTQFGTCGRAKGQFRKPYGLAVSSTGQLYVCDRGNNRIQVFQNDKFVFLFGKYGSEPGNFTSPCDVVLNDTETELFIADTDNNRIQVFTPDGKLTLIFGKSTSIPHQLIRPFGIHYTPDDHVMVTSTKGVVLVCKSDGTFLSAIKGQDRFTNPTGIVMRHNGQIVISTGGGEWWDGCKLFVF